MEQNLVGYLLNALDPETHRKVERYLQSTPAAQQKLELLKQALQPLAADREEIEAPAGLWVRTLALVAEEQCRKVDSPADSATPIREVASSAASVTAPAKLKVVSNTTAKTASSRPRPWRLLELAIAASIVLCLGLLIPPLLVKSQRYYQQLACANNLRSLGVALLSYQATPDGGFPNPAAEAEPRNVAGFSIALLREAGYAQDAHLRCPASFLPHSSQAWGADQLRNMNETEFKVAAPSLLGSYAYSLGYRTEEDQVASYRVADGNLPIMSDSPMLAVHQPGLRNSENHYGRGQNVLFTGGHVQFLTKRLYQNDDLFLNRENKIEPGLQPTDFVLGTSATPVSAQPQ